MRIDIFNETIKSKYVFDSQRSKAEMSVLVDKKVISALNRHEGLLDRTQKQLIEAAKAQTKHIKHGLATLSDRARRKLSRGL